MTILESLQWAIDWIDDGRELGQECEAKLAEARDAIARSGWQPIETAPKDGSYFLVTNAELVGSWIARWCPVAVSGYRFDDPWRSVMLNCDHIPAEFRYMPAARWMPLPEGPK